MRKMFYALSVLLNGLKVSFLFMFRHLEYNIVRYIFIIIHALVFAFICIKTSQDIYKYLVVWLISVVLSSVELGSRYKDEPTSVLLSAPGILYITTNGLIGCLGLFCITTFKLEISLKNPNEVAQNTLNILQASLGSMFVMRSSFLKLGQDSKIDLGLNLILKKLLEMIDREVDRVRAKKRSNDVTSILKKVSYIDTKNKLIPYCLDVMQNISPEERKQLTFDLNAIEVQDEKVDAQSRKLSAGLLVYNIVGKSVLETAVNDLDLKNTSENEDLDVDDFSDSRELINEAVAAG